MLLDLCNALEELTEEEKTAELLPISVQQLYLLRRLGKTDEADKLASGISLQEYGDSFYFQNQLLTRD